MKDIWFISDTHFCHANILTFMDGDNKCVRSGFTDVEDMNETMIQRWNDVVKPGDKVYHLGDVIMKSGKDDIQRILSRLNGSKRLLVGNHDDHALKNLMPYFQKIGLWRIFKEEGFICSHIPLMCSQWRAGVIANVHGHIHQNLMPETSYINVCVEQTDYRPINMDEIRQRMRVNRQS